MKFLSLLVLLITSQILIAQETVTLSGYVKDSKEELLYAKVYIPELQAGVISNEYGFYSIEVPKKESYLIIISHISHGETKLNVSAMENNSIDLVMKNSDNVLETVEVNAVKSEAKAEIESTEMSVVKIDVKKAKLLPSIGGETDVLKVAQLLPGINRGGEGGTSFFVRGGDGDQNLILVDEATVYNPGHLFGFFSVFNPDVIKDMRIYKGGFPANYGGRLSSVTDIRMKEGDMNKLRVEGGIGLLSSRLTVDAPIWKDRISFMVSGRRTYIDQVFKLVGQDLPYFFYDLNGKINFKVSKKDRIYLSSYFGDDVLAYDAGKSDSSAAFGFGFNLGNFTQTLRWNHVYNAKLFSNISLIHTRFKYNIRGQYADNQILIKSAVRDLSAKYAFTYFKSNDTKLKFGTEFINHNFRPNVLSTSGEIGEFLENQEGKLLKTFEGAVYGNIRHDFSKRLTFSGGLRLSASAPKGKIYGGIEPRANFKYTTGENSSLKLSYSRMTQYMHRVSSSSVALPTDLWYPISAGIRPQSADQIAAGYNLYLPKLKSSLIIETYGKYMKGLTEYKEGSNLILNDNFEELLVQGRGWSYGAEFLLKKDEGRLTGWLGYTLSWTKRQFDEINDGEAFFAKYDRRHYLTAVGTLELSPRVYFSAIFEYATGARFTPIIGQYFQPNAGLTGVEIIPVFAEKNSYKMSSSHRLDVNFVFKSKPEKKFQTEWHVGAYNVYNRATPYQIKITQGDNGAMKYTQPGLFGFIPSVAFNFKF
ncbi:MAG: TonB-dependent receptor plug domain-containing protein [Crocinitomix sp.]|nr:TonB-dependent receptor plug domain-containing protein [Crocinitomix sp.]